MEKYGTIPPGFTKAWWEYVWEYYKIHIIGTIVAVVLVVTTAVQCASRVEYDLDIMHISADIIDTEAVCTALERDLGASLTDATGDEEIRIFVTSIPVVPVNPQGYSEAEKFNIQLMTKVDVELTFGEKRLILASEGVAQMMKDKVSYYGYMEDLSGLGDYGEKALVAEDGRTYAVSVSGNSVLEAAGIDTNGLYLMVRTELGENDEKLLVMHKNAVSAAKYILG